MVPLTCERNFTPTSTELVSPELATAGVVVPSQMLHGQVTLTTIPPPGVSRLPLSSIARLLITLDPGLDGIQWYVQLAPPVARCHDVPPSTETSTPATMPSVSDAVPLITTSVWPRNVDPLTGEPIVDVGAWLSVDTVAATRPPVRVAGCTPMSANRLTVACRMSVFAAGPPVPSWFASSPHGQRIVPAPNTSAPLLWR